jgi:tRNA(Ile2) C34 agmatinyltransferase TiaS
MECVMSPQRGVSTDTYRCPECGGVLSYTGRSWGCRDCRYVPGHGAD